MLAQPFQKNITPYHSLNLEKKYMQHWYYNTGTFFSWIL